MSIDNYLFSVEEGSSCPEGKTKVLGSCRDCTRGFYKDAGGDRACSKCPEGKTTLLRGSIKPSDCSKPLLLFLLRPVDTKRKRLRYFVYFSVESIYIHH